LFKFIIPNNPILGIFLRNSLKIYHHLFNQVCYGDPTLVSCTRGISGKTIHIKNKVKSWYESKSHMILTLSLAKVLRVDSIAIAKTLFSKPHCGDGRLIMGYVRLTTPNNGHYWHRCIFYLKLLSRFFSVCHCRLQTLSLPECKSPSRCYRCSLDMFQQTCNRVVASKQQIGSPPSDSAICIRSRSEYVHIYS
jgi:hypothetical protein